MATTNFGRLTDEQKTVWIRDTWKQARNEMFLSKFMGEGHGSMVQHITSLTKTEKGARAVITLVADIEGDGVAGDRRLKGNEEAIKAFDRVVRVDQLRHAHISEGRMSDQKSIVRFRETARDQLAYWMADRVDQMAFLTLSGVAYSNKNNGGTRVGSDLPNLEFASDVSAPTSGRVYRWNGTTGALVLNGATSDVTAADLPSYDMIVKIKAELRNNYVRGIRKGGKETYHMFLSPLAMAALKLDPDYKEAVRMARERGASNPTFTGEGVDLDGIVIHDFRHVYNTSGTATKWGAGNAIDGCQILVCGAQALAFADIGQMTWVEEDEDYENQAAISTGKIFGFLKPKFQTQYGPVANTVQDFGVVSIYVAQ